jgi:hypothetical protein
LESLELLAQRLLIELTHARLWHGVQEDDRVWHPPCGKALAEVSSMRAVVTVAPGLTPPQANGVIGGPQGAAACLGRRRTEKLGISRLPQ